jgi:P4 family phage/plasmid primase-like protien
MDIEKMRIEYSKKNLITFGLNISQNFHEKEKKWKKHLIPPKKWTDLKLDNKSFNKNNDGLGMITGKVNGIFVIDIDDIEDWKYLLKETGNKEPITVKAISGQGGIHLFFKYDETLENISSKSCAITYNSKQLKIDIRSNGGFIIVAPSCYDDKNTGKKAVYKWKKSILKHELSNVPKWLIDLIIEDNKIIKIEKKIKNNDEINFNNIEIEKNFLKEILYNLDIKRCNNYDNWIKSGMAIKSSNPECFDIWDEWSKQSKKYDAKICYTKWNSFDKNGEITFGSLLYWLKEDNITSYNTIINKLKHNKKVTNIVLEKKKEFRNGKYNIDNICMNDILQIVNNGIHTTVSLSVPCPFTKKMNDNHTVYIDIFSHGEMIMKCSNSICFGKWHPMNPVSIPPIMLIQNNFYGTNLETEKYDYKMLINDDVKIFEDIELNKLIIRSLSGTHYKLAEVLFYLTNNKYRYSKIDDSKNIEVGWYEFENHRWIESDTIRSTISDILPNYYKKIIEFIIDNDNSESKIKKVSDIIKSLETTGTKDCILKELQEIHKKNFKTKFMDLLDSHPYLIGFNNGIYDLHSLEFRDGQPEDYVSMTVGYDYISKSTNNRDKILNFFNNIQPEKIERDYLLTYLSTNLEGVNKYEGFHILIGSKRNGKSSVTELTCETLGDYADVIQSQLLTEKRPMAGIAQPEILELDKKRSIFASELRKSDKFNTAFIKGLVGNDKCKARNLYKGKYKKFTPVFKLNLSCNEKPMTDNPDDQAFFERCRIINFPITFVDDPQNEYEMKKDVSLKENFKNWRQDFMLILLEYYKLYKINGLTPTKKILQYTLEYKNNQDIYINFINECICKDKNGYIIWTELRDKYSNWYVNNIDNNIPYSKDVKIYFEDKFFKCKESSHGIQGIKKTFRGWVG